MNDRADFWAVYNAISEWSDNRHYLSVMSCGKVLVMTKTDVSSEAKVVCQFLNMLLPSGWTFSKQIENDGYTFIFDRSEEKMSSIAAIPIQTPQKRKKKSKNKDNQQNTLF